MKICTGCGNLNTIKIEKPAFACCPDNNYVPITVFEALKDLTFKTKLLKILPPEGQARDKEIRLTNELFERAEFYEKLIKAKILT